jgi:hypothetical protein
MKIPDRNYSTANQNKVRALPIYNSRVEATLTNLNLLELLVSKDLDPESQEFFYGLQKNI